MKVEFNLNCSGSWVDFSNFVDVSNLKLTKNLDAQNDPQKNIVGDIESFGDAYTFIYNNLINNVNLYSNSICVRITDSDYAQVLNFKIETKNLKWCDNDDCKLKMSLVEYNPIIDCVKNTIISDNTNGEFQPYPVSGNPHPRFKYCDVIKPTFFFGFIITFANAIDAFILSLNLVLASVFNPVFVVINAFFGTSFVAPNIPYVGPTLVGCERMFPAPFVRTYIDNVCTICPNITVNSSTDVPFHDPISIYYNTCLLTAPSTKGVKSVSGIDYLVTNRPSWTLFDLMSKIKYVYNAAFFFKDLYNGNYELHFARKDLLGVQMWGGTPNINFAPTGTDKQYLIGNVCYSWNGQGKASRINMGYSSDASDNIGNELKCRFNGEYISPSNPNYNTPIERITTDFGACSFVLDGKDTLWDANLQLAIGAVLSGADYGGVLKMQGDTLQLAKLIVWDGLTPLTDARPYKDLYTPYVGIEAFSDDEGGFFPITTAELRNWNFPMSFDPDAQAINGVNLWGFHAIDIPTNGKKTNIAFEFNLQFCTQYINIELYMSVQFENGEVGEINEITYDFFKREINIKGNLK